MRAPFQQPFDVLAFLAHVQAHRIEFSLVEPGSKRTHAQVEFRDEHASFRLFDDAKKQTRKKQLQQPEGGGRTRCADLRRSG